MIKISCPKCTKASNAEQEMLGRKVVCQFCKHEFICERSMEVIENLQNGGTLLKAMPFVVFFICAVIAGCAGVGVFAQGPMFVLGFRLEPEWLRFLLVFFGLASIVLPIVLARRDNR